MEEYRSIEDLPREKLIELCRTIAKNTIALDGVWFQAVEREHGFDDALALDVEAWRRYTTIEARRIRQLLGLPERSGLQGLARALEFRSCALVNRDELLWEGDSLVYRVVECRVQEARRRKGMQYHTCKPPGLVEYAGFASAIDDRIATEALSCHPDVADPTCNCSWKFSLPQ